MPLKPPSILSAGTVRIIDRILAGQRQAVCTIQRPVSDRDAGGAPMRVWDTTAVRDCRVVRSGVSAIEAVRGGRLTAEAGYELRIDRDTYVGATYRILVDGNPVEVTGPPSIATNGFEQVIPISATT